MSKPREVPSRFRVLVVKDGAGWKATIPAVPGATVHAPELQSLDHTVRETIRLHNGAPDVGAFAEPIQLEYDYSGATEGIGAFADLGARVRQLVEEDRLGVSLLLRAAATDLDTWDLTPADYSHLLNISAAHAAELVRLNDGPDDDEPAP